MKRILLLMKTDRLVFVVGIYGIRKKYLKTLGVCGLTVIVLNNFI